MANQWDKELTKLFKPILSGKLSASLTPDILSPEDLHTIIDQHKTLANPYFAKNVYNLYQTSNVILTQAFIDIYQRSVTVHQVLTFPMTYAHSLFPYYQVFQTGIIKNGICFTLDLPRYIYEKNGEFHPLDSHNCRPNSPIATCYLPLLKETMNTNSRCLNHFANCSLNQVACRTAYSYDNSGILITSQDKITAYQLDPSQHAEKSITAISVTQFQTAFLSWERTKFVQIGDLFVERPNLISSNIEPQLQSHLLEKWSQFLNSSVSSIRI